MTHSYLKETLNRPLHHLPTNQLDGNRGFPAAVRTYSI